MAGGVLVSKECGACKLTLPLTDFHKNSRAKDGVNWSCKKCKNAHEVEYRKRVPSKPRPRAQIFAYNLKKNYGITPAEYDEMNEKQQGLCAVCLLPERSIDPKTGLVKNLAVHHNHSTGKVIALCCAECNMGMGKLKDDPALLRRAAELNEVT